MLSVVLAVHNEEKNLARCLDSVKQLADEIIVVDGESTDKTVDIARKYTTKVISTTNKTNFHINKQMAMDAAQGDLILQLDADEVIDKELEDFIGQLKSDPGDVSAWWLKRKNYFLSKFLTKGGQYPDPVIRLYKNGKARLPQKNVHEQMQVDGRLDTAPGHLLHYPYPTFASYIKKFIVYTNFEAERLAKEKINLNISKSLSFLILKPFATFFLLYLRHKGFMDKFPGLIFALMSSLHHPFVYLHLKEKLGESK